MLHKVRMGRSPSALQKKISACDVLMFLFCFSPPDFKLTSNFQSEPQLCKTKTEVRRCSRNECSDAFLSSPHGGAFFIGQTAHET